MQHLTEYMITKEPFYLAQEDELDIAEAAYNHAIPLLLKGPTGCGKTTTLYAALRVLNRPDSQQENDDEDDSGRTKTTMKSVLCNRVWNFTKMTLDSMKFHTSAASGRERPV